MMPATAPVLAGDRPARAGDRPVRARRSGRSRSP